jgi:hypothetical protein
VESRSVGSARLTELVEDYARRIYPAVLDQHSAASVCSPLGVWLLLAACAPVADGENRHALEGALGCSGDEAHELLSGFLAVPPPALKAAIAVWTSMTDASEAIAAWVRGLPAEVESGYMPTKAEADGWANRKTLGLIKTFPLQIDEMTRVVLASALATKVSWELPFDVTPAGEHLGTDSPWRGAVKRLLWDRAPRPAAMIASTSSAGLVAVHPAIAREDLTVISVSAHPAVSRRSVRRGAGRRRLIHPVRIRSGCDHIVRGSRRRAAPAHRDRRGADRDLPLRPSIRGCCDCRPARSGSRRGQLRVCRVAVVQRVGRRARRSR